MTKINNIDTDAVPRHTDQYEETFETYIVLAM